MNGEAGDPRRDTWHQTISLSFSDTRSNVGRLLGKDGKNSSVGKAMRRLME